MSNFLYKDSHIIDLNSQWVGDSLVRTVTRHFGKKNKIMVDVTEISRGRTSKKRAMDAARQAARRVGCTSVDCSNVRDSEIVRESMDIRTDEPTRTNIRTMTFAFDGIE